MYKVIIVDDEHMIRQGLRTMVDWEKYGCQVCAEAEDGTEAQKLIRQYKPEILFTDIKMNEMDGLTMIRGIKEAVPDCKIIVMTGYREFDYAKEAISMGVFEFLLKPMELESIHEVLGRAVEKLRQEQAVREEMAQYQTELELSRQVFMERTFYEILYGITRTEAVVKERLEVCGIRDGACVLAIAELDGGAEATEERSLYDCDFRSLLHSLLQEEAPAVIALDQNRIAMLFWAGRESYQQVCETCAEIQEQLEGRRGVTVSIGVSARGTGVLELPRLRKECEIALEQKHYIGKSALIRAEDVEMFFEYQDFVELDALREAILEAVTEAREEEALGTAEKIFQYIRGMDQGMTSNIQDYYWSILSALRKLSGSFAEPGEAGNKDKALHQKVYSCMKLEELQALLDEHCRAAAALIRDHNYNNAGIRVQAIIKYINENYDKNITLTDVGEKLYASPYYISRIFKQETGTNLIDYINEVRVERAKELLKNPQYKIYEVGEMVGISDSHYFSKLFRKISGLSPKEYRAGL